MSQHVLGHATKPGAHFIVGYDRPLQAFFLQVWEPQEEDCPVYTDDCFDLDLLGDIGAVVPPELRGILVEECLGKRDPNYRKDWRA